MALKVLNGKSAGLPRVKVVTAYRCFELPCSCGVGLKASEPAPCQLSYSIASDNLLGSERSENMAWDVLCSWHEDSLVINLRLLWQASKAEATEAHSSAYGEPTSTGDGNRGKSVGWKWASPRRAAVIPFGVLAICDHIWDFFRHVFTGKLAIFPVSCPSTGSNSPVLEALVRRQGQELKRLSWGRVAACLWLDGTMLDLWRDENLEVCEERCNLH